MPLSQRTYDTIAAIAIAAGVVMIVIGLIGLARGPTSRGYQSIHRSVAAPPVYLPYDARRPPSDHWPHYPRWPAIRPGPLARPLRGRDRLPPIGGHGRPPIGGHGRAAHREHFSGSGPDESEWFGSSHQDSAPLMQRTSVRSDDGSDDEDYDSSREFSGRIFASDVMDPAVTHEADEYARSMRCAMMGADLPPCNCAPDSCRCPWGMHRAREVVSCKIYPDVPHRPLTPEVGVDVGPATSGYWRAPDGYTINQTPHCWEDGAGEDGSGEDYYGPEGPTAHIEGMYHLTEPDHVLLH
jgi:hypothetical protein